MLERDGIDATGYSMEEIKELLDKKAVEKEERDKKWEEQISATPRHR